MNRHEVRRLVWFARGLTAFGFHEAEPGTRGGLRSLQAQRREAWGESPRGAASGVVRPRPYGLRLSRCGIGGLTGTLAYFFRGSGPVISKFFVIEPAVTVILSCDARPQEAGRSSSATCVSLP